MSTSLIKRHFSELNNTLDGSQSKKRKTVDCQEDKTMIEFLNLGDNVLSDDVEYFIQKDYNIEGRFLQPRFFELSKDNAMKLVRLKRIEVDGEPLQCQLYEGKPQMAVHNSHYRHSATHYKHDRYKAEKPPLRPTGCAYTVWVGNITKKASKQHLVEVLRDFGPILNVFVLSQNNNAYNCAFVDFSSPFDVVAIGRAVFHRKLKIYQVPIAVVLREKTIDLLFENGYHKQLTQMIEYGMLNTKHCQYYTTLCEKYHCNPISMHRDRRNHRKRMRTDKRKKKKLRKIELEDGELEEDAEQGDTEEEDDDNEDGEINDDTYHISSSITYLDNITIAYDEVLKKRDIEIAKLKHNIMKRKHRTLDMQQDLNHLISNESVTERVDIMTNHNKSLETAIDEYKKHTEEINLNHTKTVDTLGKQKSRLYAMQQQFGEFQKNHDTVLAQWDERRREWGHKQAAAKQQNHELLQSTIAITQQVRDEKDMFGKLDMEQKATKARCSVFHHKVEMRKKEMEETQKHDDQRYALMEEEYNKFTPQLQSEQKQHENTQKVLAETVAKVKAGIKNINQRAQQKDRIVERLQKRLQLYKQHLKRSVMIQPCATNSHS